MRASWASFTRRQHHLLAQEHLDAVRAIAGTSSSIRVELKAKRISGTR
jgi:hypothetical protein